MADDETSAAAEMAADRPARQRSRGPIEPDLVRRVPELRRHLAIVSSAALIVAAAVVSQAEVLARGIAHLVGAADTGPSVTAMVTALVIVAAVRALVAWVIERSAATTMAAARRRIRSAVVGHAVAGGDRTDGGLGTREATVATAGVDQLEPYVRQYLPALAQAIALPVVAGARIALADWVSAAIVVVTVPLIPIFMVLIGMLTERRARRSWAVLQRLGSHFLDVLEGLPTLRLFGRGTAQPAGVRKVSERYRATTMSTLRIAMLSALALELLATLSVAVIAVAIGLRLIAGGLTLATGLVVLLLAPECYLPLRRVGASYHAAQTGLDAAADLGDLLDRPTPPTGARAVPNDVDIELHDVVVRRGDRRLALAAHVAVRRGEVVAIVGPSGVGKSTMLDAVRGRLVDRSGQVLVAGVDVAELDPEAWADRLTVIPQRPEPLAPTVAAEVAAGNDVSPTDVAAALAEVGLPAAGTERLAEREPQLLSGGQFRRVQVARSIVAVRTGRASVVIADEPTAQLDHEAAALVAAAIRRLADEVGATVIVATHDAHVAAVADRVVGLTSNAKPGERTTPAPTRSPDPIEPTREPPPETRTETPTEAGAPHADAGPSDATPAGAVAHLAALRNVLAAANPARRRLVLAATLGSLAEICTIGLAGVSAWLIVRASERPDIAAVALVVTGVRAFGVGKGVFRYAERLASHDAGLRALAELRARVVDRLANVAPADLPNWRRGDVLNRVVDDVDRLLDLFVRILVPTISVAVTTALAAIVTLLIDPMAALVLVAGLLIVSFVVPFLTVASEARIAAPLNEARAALRSEVLDVTEHADALVAHRLVEHRRRAIDVVGARVDRLERRRATVRASTAALLAAAPAIVVAATIVAVRGDVASIGAPLIGVLILWPLAIVELNASVNEAAAALPGIGGAATRIGEVLDLQPDPSARADVAAFGEHPAVSLDAVRAQWPTTGRGVGPVDLDVPPSATVAVVGPSGSGKSTLAAAMVDFCPIVDGTYGISDAVAASTDRTYIDAATVDGDVVRRTVTWIEQTPWIADTTVRENLRIADRSASDASMLEALRAVRLGDWVDVLPEGLDTHVGRHGTAMSGGEAHRLALARVLLAGHPVVVLDEPTSHLDASTAAAVVNSVRDRLRGRSVILLTHEVPDVPLDGTAVLGERTASGPAVADVTVGS